VAVDLAERRCGGWIRLRGRVRRNAIAGFHTDTHPTTSSSDVDDLPFMADRRSSTSNVRPLHGSATLER
jgi:hypothetical protein